MFSPQLAQLAMLTCWFSAGRVVGFNGESPQDVEQPAKIVTWFSCGSCHQGPSCLASGTGQLEREEASIGLELRRLQSQTEV